MRPVRSVRYLSRTGIMPRSLLRLLPSPAGLYHVALMLCWISYKLSSGIKVSSSLSNYEPYKGSVPKFYSVEKYRYYNCIATIKFMVFGTIDVHIVIHGTKGCYISTKKSSTCNLMHTEPRPCEVLLDMCKIVCIPPFPLPRRILVLILLPLFEWC